MNLPVKFEDRMRRLLGEEYKEYLASYSKPHFGGIRVNTLKISPEEFEKICPFSIKKIPWTTNGYYYDIKEQPARHPYYHAGLYYIQEPSAMTPASLLPVKPGDKVLDLCAAPGGKSTELGAKLKGEGLLVSNDISNSRAKALLKNIELFGIRNALVLSEAPEKLLKYFPEYFDKILIDAPCSGEGMFRKSQPMIKNWEEFGVDYYHEIQKEIIIYAARMLKPGGMMLYSTCTFSPEENEGTIAFLLEQYPEFQVVKALPDPSVLKELNLSYEGFDSGKPEWLEREITQEIKDQLANGIRLWPHKLNGEGHFMALLRKNTGTEIKAVESALESMDAITNRAAEQVTPMQSSRANVGKQSIKSSVISNKSDISEEASEFLKTVKIVQPGMKLEFLEHIESLYVHENRIYLVPEMLPDLKGLRVLRQGLLLGEMKKQRFEPSQALANALTPLEYDKIINLSGDSMGAIRYLKCESIEAPEDCLDGWQLVCADGFPLGWAKTAKGSLKNKYQAAWRWM